MFRTMGIADLYIASLPQGKISSVFPKKRQEQIQSTQNEILRIQRFYVWKLLEYALNRSFGLKLKDVEFTVDEQGKWGCDKCFFSLSHSGDALAVALSRKPIGVDIESLQRELPADLSEAMLTPAEKAEFLTLEEACRAEFLIEKWCAKESVFKASTQKSFTPETVETASDIKNNLRTGKVTVNSNSYCYSVFSEDVNKLRIYENIDL